MPQFIHKYRLALIVSLLLLAGFALRTFFVYQNSRHQIRESIIEQGLPLTGDTIYSEINKDILRPIFISSLMAHDTFLKDWIINGEGDVTQINRYLKEVKDKYGTVSSFFISEKTRRYYYGNGVLKTISEKDRHDVWYFRARAMKTDYVVDVDSDEANRGRLTVFINHRVVDSNGKFLGITGVGLTIDKIASFVHEYEKRFNRHIYFADKQGNLVLTGVGQQLKNISGLSNYVGTILSADKLRSPLRLEYIKNQHNMLLNVRYIPDLSWYLLVEQDETEALAGLNRDLVLQMATSTPVLLLILAIIIITIQKNQNQLNHLVSTDALTGCLNRHAFLARIPAWKKRFQRTSKAPQVLLVDLDHFKNINDQFGHLEGDAVLKHIAHLLQEEAHTNEMVVRWGGEEFLLFLQRPDQVEATAERLRKRIASQEIRLGSPPLKITASIGATEWQTGESLDHVVARADIALYEAKHGGRDQVCVR